jgi:hypothetical protein
VLTTSDPSNVVEIFHQSTLSAVSVNDPTEELLGANSVAVPGVLFGSVSANTAVDKTRQRQIVMIKYGIKFFNMATPVDMI